MFISPMDLATYYGVDDIPAAISIDDNLHSLLVAIFRNEPLTSPRYDILASYGLNALGGFINGDMTLPEFRRQSAVEQEQRQGEIVNILLKIKNSFLPTKQILIGL